MKQRIYHISIESNLTTSAESCIIIFYMFHKTHRKEIRTSFPELATLLLSTYHISF